MSDLSPFVVSALGGAVAGGALTYAVMKLHELRSRLHRLEAKLAPCSKHDLAYLARQDIGEAVLFDYAKLRDELEVFQAKLETATLKARHVASGGSPDDPPAMWIPRGGAK